jgi:tetratricopeptide (TPR) repeat protein
MPRLACGRAQTLLPASLLLPLLLSLSVPARSQCALKDGMIEGSCSQAELDALTSANPSAMNHASVRAAAPPAEKLQTGAAVVPVAPQAASVDPGLGAQDMVPLEQAQREMRRDAERVAQDLDGDRGWTRRLQRIALGTVDNFVAEVRKKGPEISRQDMQGFGRMLQVEIDEEKALGRIERIARRENWPPDRVQTEIAKVQERTRTQMNGLMSGAMSDFHNAFDRTSAQFPRPQWPGRPGGDQGPGGGKLPSRPHIDDMLRADPRNGGYWNISAQDRMRSGDLSGAIADATRAIENGGGADALATRAGAHLGLRDYENAHRDAKAALGLDPQNQAAFAAMKMSEGRVTGGGAAAAAPPSGNRGFTGADSFGGGRASFNAAAGYNAGAAAAARFNDQAKAALRMNDDASALDFAARALASDPNNALAHFLRASALYRSGKFREAAEAAGKGLALEPKNLALLQVSARSLLKDKDYTGAAAAANRALELDPSAAWAFAARGYAAAGAGDRAGALADLKAAAMKDPSYQDAYEKALRTPTEEDLEFLFPGEESAPGAKSAAGAPSRKRSFGVLTGAAALGGLLLALGLLSVVAKPLQEGVSSVFTRLTRRSPAVSAVPVAAAPSRSGLLQGKYELGKQIGAGGMGLVFEGTDRSLNRRVAVKRMRDEIRVDPRERARFVSEAKTVAALHHPNIVDIYAVVEEAEDLHLVFEFVEGRTLHELVSSSGRFAPADAVKVVRGAAAALDYAHSRGVIHRDMKPSNLMLDGHGRVKVMDFGIARAAKDVMTRVPMTNTIVGTPPYMAPEQEQGQVRKESDVYALAVCAYELLCGRLPFPGVGAGMLMNKINMSYVPPSKMADHLPAPLDEVFAKAFQPDPEKRYRAAGEFAGALEAALSAPVKA